MDGDTARGPRSPFRRRRYEKHVVARAGDVPEGSRLLVEVEGRSIGIFHVEGRYYALLNRCPHNGGPLGKGEVVGLIESSAPGDWKLDPSRKFLACPWHGWEYDLATGESWWNPRTTRAQAYGVRLECGRDVAQAVAEGTAETQGAKLLVDPATHRVKGPFTAEVMPIAVEDDYLVISLLAPAVPIQESLGCR